MRADRAAVILVLAVLAVGCLGAPGLGAAPAISVTAGASPSEQARELQMRSVVREWSARLNANDNEGIARLFTVPATMTQGVYVYRLVTRSQIALWHSELPCSGRIVSITLHGRFATAVFSLGNRGSTKCDAPGALAAARFEIVKGKIVSWTQLPTPPKPKGATAVAYDGSARPDHPGTAA